MQTFIDTTSQQVYAFDDDVIVSSSNGVYKFTTANGRVLDAPTTLQPHVVPSPTGSELLAQAQSVQIAMLYTKCQAAITAVYTSSALGDAHMYPADVITQGNVDRAAQHGGSLWCENGTGAWSLALHTSAQALQVQSDMWSHIQAQQSHLATLVGEVNAATSVSAVQSVTW